MSSRIILLLFIFQGFLFNVIAKDDWNLIKFNDSLEVYLNEKYAGILQSRISVNDSFIEMRNILDIGTKMLEKRIYRIDGTLIYAEQEMDSPSGKNYWKLFRHGEQCTLLVSAGGIEHKKSVSKVHETINSIYELYHGIQNSSLKVGTRWNDTTFELTSGEYVFTETVCKEIPDKNNGNTWVFECDNSITGKNEIWKLDKNGKTLYREIYPFIVRVPNHSEKKEVVEQSDFFETFKIPVQKKASPGQKISIRFDSTIVLDSSVLSYYQKDKDAYVLKTQKQVCSDRTLEEKVHDSLLIYTTSTPIMQTDNPEIIKLSKILRKKSGTACELIKNCNDYVFKSIKKQNSATFSSAVETLKSGFGDCGEHAVLSAALLRAAGIPSRVVMGVVYMESGRGYYYHAWVAAFAGEWLFADPSHGVFPANYDRVPLSIDDTGQRMMQLSKYIGRVKIEHTSR